MTTKTILNSTNNKTLINTGSGSEVDNLTGTVVLEQYTLLNRINSPSGEAALYMAISNASSVSSVPNQPVVVKIYRRKDAVKPEVLNKIAELKSPGIVEIIDHGYYNESPCIVMPYYKNGSLAGKTLSYDVIRDIVIPDVSQGLKYLHKNGIIHKDIKPANLMISNDGRHIHIIDFGISSAKDDGVSILITKTGMSPEYCAPETFNNVWVEESDFYSLGITLFELFKGHTPYKNSSDRGELAANASIQKINFSLDFPVDLINLIKGLTYKDLSNRNDVNNPNRRWTWKEIEKWLKGKTVPVPGELNSGNDISDSDSSTGESSYTFSKPYDFRNNKGQIVKLNTLPEFTEAFGTNWKDGKKHIGRGFASKFFIQQDMQNSASIIMDCEEAGVSDMAYAKMLIELSASSCNYDLYWDSVKIHSNMKFLSDKLTGAMFNKSSNLNEEFNNIKQLLCFWYKTSGKIEELGVIENLQKIATVKAQRLDTQIIALCSFIDPNMAIKIGDDVFQNIDELITYTKSQKINNEQQYYEWVHKNQNHIKEYTECINSKIKNCSERLLADWQNELNRRKNEKIRRKQEELARKQREEQERKQREEQERRQREERERKQREEQERRQREEQERRQREERERRQREEQERKQREEEERRLQEELTQAPQKFLSIVKKGLKKGMIVPFGSYPQNKYGFKAPIEWLVLDVTGNEALLISRKGIDCKLYNHSYVDNLTWEDCDLRKWLNSDFIKSAFSDADAKKIKVSNLENDNNPEYGTKGGNNTNDRIFCLSIAETERYFNSDEDRKCEPTAYAVQQGTYVGKGQNYCNWLLRSPGGNVSNIFSGNSPNCFFAAEVFNDGRLCLCGHGVGVRGLAVRPALRIICDEELERRQREEQEQELKQLKELQAQTYKNFLAIIKTGIRKGMIIPFGSYPQNENGCRVPIEWLVLDVKKSSLTNRLFNTDNKIEALLISRYVLDCKQYHHNYTDITWEDSELRKWLNNDFIKSAFSEEEAKIIKVSELKNEENREYRTRGGNDTKDHVFCLSITEAEQYFRSDYDRRCEPTAYARNHGAYVKNDRCFWWLRSPGRNQDNAAYVEAGGSLYLYGCDINYVSLAVRPALRIICNETLEQRKQREEEERKQREEQERRQKELLAQAHEEFSAIIKKGIRKGMIIPFGAYPQDNDSFRTPIEWLVLDVKKTNFLNRVFAKNKLEVLLISRYALDCIQYNSNQTNLTWEDCDLRKWLNSDFLKSAFSTEEAERILISEIENDDNPKFRTRGGENTKDRIFCLSIAEVKKYFSNDEDRTCKTTAYAREQGAYVNNGYCYWRLRSPGNCQSHASYVYSDGVLNLNGGKVDRVHIAVRPALRVICNL